MMMIEDDCCFVGSPSIFTKKGTASLGEFLNNLHTKGRRRQPLPGGWGCLCRFCKDEESKVELPVDGGSFQDTAVVAKHWLPRPAGGGLLPGKLKDGLLGVEKSKFE
jgi:hypothetical protein